MKEDSKPAVTDVPSPREIRKKLKQQEISDVVASIPRVQKKPSDEPFVPKINRIKQIRKGRPAKFNVFKKI